MRLNSFHTWRALIGAMTIVSPARAYEGRRSQRKNVFLSAKLVDGTRTYDVIIRDLSSLGASVQLDQTLRGDIITLCRGRHVAHASVARSEDRTVSLHFLSPIDPGTWVLPS